ncbi:MAG: metallopeptidase TldD-related protein [Pseudomonadota bacterium]
MRPPTRREFLGASAAGLCMVSMPRFLAGCAHPVPPSTAVVPDNPFLAWFGIDQGLIAQVLAELTGRGADQAELYFQHARASSITLEDSIISRASSSIDLGVGLRCVVGDQTGYAYTEDLTLESMLQAARTASSIAHAGGGPVLESFRFVEHKGLYTIAQPLSQVAVEQKLPLVEKIATQATNADPAVEKVRVIWADSEEHVLIATMDGAMHTDVRPMTRVWCTVNARRGDEVQSNSSNLAGRRGFDFYDQAQVDKLVREAIDRTMILFEAKRPPAGPQPVVLAAGASGILLHEAIGHGMEADFNRKGTSIFADMLGRKVSSEHVTIVDSGIEPSERGALNVDDEGHDTQYTKLVENGILKSYMHDGISARHYGVTPTGNGRRESFRFAPVPRMRCTFMENGPHSPEEIIASVKKGIVAETFTNGQVKIGAGDFTFYVKNGWLIEDGKKTAPIKDCNIIGNGPDVLTKITMVGDDFKLDTGGWTCGKDGQGVPVSQGLPTALVSSITVGGEDA